MRKPNGSLDYSKLFMAIAMAIIAIMQQYQTGRLNEIKATQHSNTSHIIKKIEDESF